VNAVKITARRRNEWAGEEVDRVLRSLPAPLRARTGELEIVLQPAPTRAQLRDGVDPDLMGLFEGEPFADEDQRLFPARLFLFLENIWDEAEGDAETFRREVRTTLLHELGHYLGLEESDLALRDLE